MSGVFITDGHSRAAIQIVRSLGEKGIDVFAGEYYKTNPTFFSKYVKKRLVYPKPDIHPNEFIDAVYDFAVKNEVEVILPVVDDCLLLLSKHRKKFEPEIKIPYAEYDKLMVGRDKAKTIELARKLGISHPKTIIAENPDLDFVKEEIGFPLILKPRESSGTRGIAFVEGEEFLKKSFSEVKERYGAPMIQEFIPYGGACGVGLLFNKGKVKAKFSYKRIRSYPVSGGPSTLRESIIYPEIEEYAIKMLEYLKWHGPAMVEFRVDAKTGEPKLMEINPRYWGSLRLPIYAGVDFPYLHYKLAINGNIDPVLKYKLGVKARWFLFGDLLWFLEQKNKLKIAPDFFKMKRKNMTYDIISMRDILPSIGSLLESFIFMLKKREYVFQRGWKGKNEDTH
jgi:predicted ATP-grasp superfamily ATP-dependent carboligase